MQERVNKGGEDQKALGNKFDSKFLTSQVRIDLRYNSLLFSHMSTDSSSYISKTGSIK